MAIAVDGYGNITQGNAKEIYVAWKRGEVELNKSQQAKCESFLSPEEMDEVQYDEKVTEKRGKDSINTDGAKDNGNGTEGSAVAAATVGAAGAAATCATTTVETVVEGVKTSKSKSAINGWVAWACAIACIAGSAAALVMSFMFDNQLDDRKQHSQNAANDNQTMDNYNENLANTMEMMNEDVEHYNDTQDTLTRTVNTQASQGADLQMQYDAAMAMGDVNGAKSLKEQMKALSEVDNSQLEDDLAETGEGIEEYRAMNAESLGCAESGQTVSDFLKAGKEKGRMAMASGVLCAVGALVAGLAVAISAIPKNWILGVPTDLPGCLSSSILWGSVALVMGTASTKFFMKASQENECGSNGDEMQDHVNSLNDMITQQTAYTDDTEGQFAESDDAAAESKDAAQEAAGKAVDGNKEGLGNKPKEEKPTAPAGPVA